MGRIGTAARDDWRDVTDMGQERGESARVSKLINIVMIDYFGVMRGGTTDECKQTRKQSQDVVHAWAQGSAAISRPAIQIQLLGLTSILNCRVPSEQPSV